MNEKEYIKNYVERRKETSRALNHAFGVDDVKLAVIQIGDNPASNSYIKGKQKDVEEMGFKFELVKLDENVSFEELIDVIENKNKDSSVTGIVLQLPLPKNFDETDIEFLQASIDETKDVDGFRKGSYFKPCTPRGIVDFLDEHLVGDFKSKTITVIGRSKIVGKPLCEMLIEKGATVISCNSKTKDIKQYTKNSDIVISAIGVPNFFTKDYFNKDSVIIDVGINRDENGRLCGDVSQEAKDLVRFATPVPGGVGLLTRLALIDNLIKAENYQSVLKL